MRSTRASLLPLFASVTLLTTALSGPALADEVPGELLVGLHPGKSHVEADAFISRAAGRAVGQIASLGVRRVKLHPGLTVEEAAARLRQHPDVVYVEVNNVVHESDAPNDPLLSGSAVIEGKSYNPQWAPQRIQAPATWDLWNPRKQVVIAVVDTGVDLDHPDLVNVIHSAGRDTINDDLDATDDRGHGTHVAGIAAAQINNGVGIAGISGWNAFTLNSSGTWVPNTGSDSFSTKILPVKVLGSDGSGTDFTVAAGIDYAVTAITDKEIKKVINLSLGSTGSSKTLYDAIQRAWTAGWVIVAAAGNAGSSTVNYPAGYANVISVGASEYEDKLCSFSNWGSSVDIVAPGQLILSTMPNNFVTMNADNYSQNYEYLHGTSMAAPHVAGQAALLLAHNPWLNNAQVSSMITLTVDPYVPYSAFRSTRTISSVGGRINLERALQQAAASLPADPDNTAATAVVPAVPDAPSGLTAASVSRSQINLTWTDNSAGGAGYKIEISRDNLVFTEIATVGANVRSYSSTGLTRNTIYYYRVRGYNTGGNSDYALYTGKTAK